MVCRRGWFVEEKRAQTVQIHGDEGFIEASSVARYRRQVKTDEAGEGTSEGGYQPITSSLQEGAAREEEEMVKR